MKLNKGIILVAILIISCSTVFAGGVKKGETIIFQDGWQNLKPVFDESQTGNFTAYSIVGEPVQDENNKWSSAWGNWGVRGTDANMKRGVVMVPSRLENDDWLVSSFIDLTVCKKVKLIIEAYSKYGTDSVNELQILISENFEGDVLTAKWNSLNFESFHKNSKAVKRTISLKSYRGKKVNIAFRSIQKGNSLKNMTRTTFISEVKVIAAKK